MIIKTLLRLGCVLFLSDIVWLIGEFFSPGRSISPHFIMIAYLVMAFYFFRAEWLVWNFDAPDVINDWWRKRIFWKLEENSRYFAIYFWFASLCCLGIALVRHAFFLDFCSVLNIFLAIYYRESRLETLKFGKEIVGRAEYERKMRSKYQD